MIMVYTFHESDIEKAVEFLRQYVDERDGKFVIEVKKYQPGRTLSQNAYWWVICTIVGSTLGCTREAAHKLLNQENNAKIINMPNGKMKLVPGETKEMTVDQMTLLIERTRVWAQQELNLYIKTPEEYKQDELIRLKNDYEKMFS